MAKSSIKALQTNATNQEVERHQTIDAKLSCSRCPHSILAHDRHGCLFGVKSVYNRTIPCRCKKTMKQLLDEIGDDPSCARKQMSRGTRKPRKSVDLA